MRNAPSEFSKLRQVHGKRAHAARRRDHGNRIYLEAMEQRQMLSVTLAFGGAGTTLNLSESSPGSTNVKISEVSATDLRIDLNGANFDPASTVAGGILTYETGTPSTSTFADINITSANAIATLNAALTGDLVSLGTISDATGGVGNLTVSGNLIQVLSPSTINTTTASAGAGNILLDATAALKIQTGATLQTKDGSITLKADTSGGNSGNLDGVDILAATVRTTGSGNILIQGTGSDDGATGSHVGVKISDAGGTSSNVLATGSGTVTITGTGGSGTTGNFGVGISGANITAVGGVSITGTGGAGSDNDIGVSIDGLNGTQVTTPGALHITGTGGGSGGSTNETGVSIANSALVLATGTGSIAITATAGTTTSNALNIATSSNVLASNGTLSLTADSMLLGSTPTISGSTVIIQPATAGTQIDVGGVNSPGVLGLSATSIDGLLGGTLQIGNASTGAIVVSGTINSPGVLAMKFVNNGAISETGTITTAALAIQSPGPVAMGGANNVQVLAATVTGQLAFTNSAAMKIGTAGGIAGVTAGGLSLTVPGLLTVGNGAGEGITVAGLADLGSNGITEGTGSIITATSLRLQGTGTVSLGNANAVGTLAADVSGQIVFRNAGNLTVGTAGASTGIHSGGNNVSLTTGGNLVIAQPIQAANGTVILAASGSISDTGTGVVAAGLGVASGTNLGTSAAPFGMAVPALVVNVSGGVSINNTGPLTIGASGSGISAGSDVLIATTGTLTVSNLVATGGNVVLAGNGAIAVLAPINGASAAVIGGSGNDNIAVSSSGTAPLTLDGRGGVDSYALNFGQLQGAINVAPTGGTNTLTASGASGSDTFGLTTGILNWNGLEFVSFTNVQQIFLLGGASPDTFNVAPIAGTNITLDGGAPDGTLPGDWLNMFFAGTTGLTASDTQGPTGHSGSFTFTNRPPVNYANMELVPTLDVQSGSGTAFTSVEGKSTGTVSLASFADPTGVQRAGTYTAIVDWGDGTAPQTLTSITFSTTHGAWTLTGSHTYALPGVYIPSIVINSSTGLSTGVIHQTATVSAIPITAGSTTVSGTEGKTISGNVATFTTTRTTAAASDYTARINWGDQLTTNGTVVKDSTGHFHVNGSHAYGNESSSKGFIVTVTILRTGANNTVVASTAKVAGVPIGSPSSRSLTGQINVPAAFVLGTFKDQNAVNTNPGVYTGTVTWGDGSSQAVLFVLLNSSSTGSLWQVRASHKFTSRKTFTTTVKLHDVANSKLVLTLNDTIKIS